MNLPPQDMFAPTVDSKEGGGMPEEELGLLETAPKQRRVRIMDIFTFVQKMMNDHKDRTTESVFKGDATEYDIQQTVGHEIKLRRFLDILRQRHGE